MGGKADEGDFVISEIAKTAIFSPIDDRMTVDSCHRCDMNGREDRFDIFLIYIYNKLYI